ncbi:MAG TPA: hypothetical protein VJ834_10945 [Burkholderiales bacterium]|nr:hypothetical protein [Burkholderiales bacterium]
MSESSDQISQHYGSEGLPSRILFVLEQAGKNLSSLTIEDLALLDRIHTRGLAATRELITFAKVGSDIVQTESSKQ